MSVLTARQPIGVDHDCGGELRLSKQRGQKSRLRCSNCLRVTPWLKTATVAAVLKGFYLPAPKKQQALSKQRHRMDERTSESVTKKGRHKQDVDQADAKRKEIEEAFPDGYAPSALVDWSEMTVPDLKKHAKANGVQGYSKMNKGALVEALSNMTDVKADIG